MLRLLFINGQKVDIDEQTAIGITYQSYDMKNPAERFVNVSNSFTIPATATNKAIFEYAHLPESLTNKPYEIALCDYWIENELILDKARVQLQSISNRIELYLYQKNDFWDIIKTQKIDDSFYSALFEYFVAISRQDMEIPTPTNEQYFATFEEFIQPYTRNTKSGIFLSMFLSNYFVNTDIKDTNRAVFLSKDNSQTSRVSGGHLSISIKLFFQFLEWRYNVNFLTSEISIPENIWNDIIVKNIHFPLRNLIVRMPTPDFYCFDYIREGEGEGIDFQITHPPYKNINTLGDSTIYDIIKTFFLRFNIILDNIEIAGEKVFRLARFDDIETKTTPIDYSEKTTGNIKFMPKLEGLAQNNFIKFAGYAPNLPDTTNSLNIVCKNENLLPKIDFITLNEYTPNVIFQNGWETPLLNLTLEDSFKNIVFLIADTVLTEDIQIFAFNPGGGANVCTLPLKKAELYELNSEYVLYRKMVEKPKVYEIKKYLSLEDIKKFRFFGLYWFDALGCACYINKISGFNPAKSDAPTTLEVIKVNEKKPFVISDTNIWTDGENNLFVDGEGNYFIF